MDATLPLFDDYKVALDAFEGPLDLLLHLIRKEEVDIYDIPIGRITSQYLDYLAQMRAMDINLAGEFIVMASTLMLIKSRLLLPRGEEKAGEEEAEEADPRLDLVRQLVEYKRCKEAADALARREVIRAAMLPRGHLAEKAPKAPPKLGDIGLDALLDALKEVLARASETVSFGHLKMQRWSVPDKMRGILGRLSPARPTPFAELFPAGAPKGEIIVTFVALLELLRLRHLRVLQAELFGEMVVEPLPPEAPDSHLPLPAFDELHY